MTQNMDMTTEAAIMQAAEHEFLEKGFDRAKTTEIARLAGVTHAMLHYYFRTKENLFNQVFREKLKIMADSFNVIYNRDLPFLERIRLGIEAHFDYIASNPRLPHFIVHEVIGNKERGELCRKILLPAFSGTVEHLSKSIYEEIKKGTVRPIEPLDLILNIVSLNAFVFIASPFVKLLANVDEEEFTRFLEHRKKQNVELILRDLQL